MALCLPARFVTQTAMFLSFQRVPTFACALLIAAVMCAIFLSVSSQSNAQDAEKDWRNDIGVFRIGVVVGDDPTGSLARIEPFRMAIADAVEMDVEFFTASDATVLIDALAADRIEYAILSASGFALASVRCDCVDPIVLPRSTDSTDGYHLVAIGRRGEIEDMQDLLSSKVAMLSVDAVAGSELVRFMLSNSVPEGEENDLAFLSRQTSEETLLAFLNGEFDVLFGWSSMTGDPGQGYTRGTLRQIGAVDPGQLQNLEIVWKSSQIPHRPHVIRKKLPGEVRTILRDTLVNMFDRNPIAYDSIEPAYGGGFSAARSERFRVLKSFIAKLSSETEDPEQQKTGGIPQSN